MEAASSYETSETVYLLVRHNIPEDLNIHELSVKTSWSYHMEARGKVYHSGHVFPKKKVAADPIFECPYGFGDPWLWNYTILQYGLNVMAPLILPNSCFTVIFPSWVVFLS